MEDPDGVTSEAWQIKPVSSPEQIEYLLGRLDAAFELMRLALTHPRFDPEPVTRIRSQLEASLRNEAEDPAWVANRQLWATLFPDHPYGRPVEGTPESLPRIDRDSLVRFAAERLARQRPRPWIPIERLWR